MEVFRHGTLMTKKSYNITKNQNKQKSKQIKNISQNKRKQKQRNSQKTRNKNVKRETKKINPYLKDSGYCHH